MISTVLMKDKKKPNSMAKETLFARFALIGGVVLMLILPWLLTQSWSGISFIETGPIGDTIGGITAPISGLLGAYLVFLALKAQVKANEKIQLQIDEQSQKELINNQRTHIQGMIDTFYKNVDQFYYSPHLFNTRFERNDLYGSQGINRFVSDFALRPQVYKWDPERSTFYLNLNGILATGSYIIDKLEKSSLDIEDKKYLLSLFQLQYYSKVYGASEHIIKTKALEQSGVKKSMISILSYMEKLSEDTTELAKKTI